MPEPEKLFYTIGEVSDLLGVKPYVLRYWESEFKKLNPQKSVTGQRTYRNRDIRVAKAIQKLLYEEKYTIAGAIKKLEELEERGELDRLEDAAKGQAPAASGPPTQAPEPPAAPAASTEKMREFRRLLESSYALLKKHNSA